MNTHIFPRARSVETLNSIIYFRAIAIFLIVAGHSYGLASFRPDSLMDRVASDIIKGSTAFFVFLSGFIFDHIYSSRYRFTSFLFHRSKKLLIPYFTLTICAILLFPSLTASTLSIETIYRLFILGDTFQAYWYIPFIVIMFTLSPLHRLFSIIKPFYQIIIIILTLILAGFIQRPIHNDNALQSVVFYTPIYLAGIFTSVNSLSIMPVLRKIWPLYFGVGLFLAFVQALSGQSDNFHSPFFNISGFELMGIQKLCFSFGLWGLFSLSDSTYIIPGDTDQYVPNRLLKLVADTSFAIFFLHPFVLKALEDLDFSLQTNFPWLALFVSTTAIIIICVLLAMMLRMILHSISKYIIGY